MKTLLSLILLTILLTSSCTKNINCKAKPDPKVQIDERSVNIDPGASVSCNF